MRSKNHMLYELYLEESGHEGVYEQTKDFSLGHIVTFVTEYENLKKGSTLEVVNITRSAAGLSKAKGVEELTDKDFSVVSSIEALRDLLHPTEVDVLKGVVRKIDEYHKNK